MNVGNCNPVPAPQYRSPVKLQNGNGSCSSWQNGASGQGAVQNFCGNMSRERRSESREIIKKLPQEDDGRGAGGPDALQPSSMGKSGTEAGISDFCGARSEGRRNANFRENLTLGGAGGPGALQTSCAREKAEAGCRLLRHVATGKQCCLSWSLKPGYGFVSIPKSRFLQKKDRRNAICSMESRKRNFSFRIGVIKHNVVFINKASPDCRMDLLQSLFQNRIHVFVCIHVSTAFFIQQRKFMLIQLTFKMLQHKKFFHAIYIDYEKLLNNLNINRKT